ncbi:hypothetical protein H7U31_02245 [Olsenella uli]|nr:hypothetical protein [Olsenella uli]
MFERQDYFKERRQSICQTTFEIPKPLKDKATAAAKKDGISRSEWIRLAIVEKLRNEEE